MIFTCFCDYIFVTQSNGKFIITGEHSVVYGEPAIVSQLNKSITVELVSEENSVKVSAYEKHIFNIFSKKYNIAVPKFSVNTVSELPQQSGLGSSAAFAHAVILALAKQNHILISKDELYALVLESEVFIHKNPSGIDPCAVVYGGTHCFQKDTHTGKMKKKRLNLSKKYNFLLVNSGPALESTGEMVTAVSNLVNSDSKAKHAIKTIGDISKRIRDRLVDGTFDGTLLEENQKQLEKLDVVGTIAKKMITDLKQNGFYSKLTGAGGVTAGSGWLLVYDSDLDRAQQFCRRRGWEIIKTEVK